METANCPSGPKPEFNMAYSWLGQMTELSNPNLQTETLKGILLQQEEKGGLIPWLFSQNRDGNTFPGIPNGLRQLALT